MSDLSERLTQARRAAGLTVPAIHQAIGRYGGTVAESTVYGWFNGSRTPGIEDLQLICASIGVSVSEVLEGVPSEPSLPNLIAMEVAQLTLEQQHAILAVVRSMRGGIQGGSSQTPGGA